MMGFQLDAGTALKYMQFGMLGTAVLTFCTTMLINAPYGRYSQAKGWGPTIPARFAWFFMESPNLVIPMIVYLHYKTPECAANYSNNILICLFIMHYINRCILYPLRMSREASPMPLSVAVMAFIFTSWNATMQALSLGMVNCNTGNEPSWLGEGLGLSSFAGDGFLSDKAGFKLRFNVGVVIFFAGFLITFHADSTLLRLSAARSKRPSIGSIPGSTAAIAAAATTASSSSSLSAGGNINLPKGVSNSQALRSSFSGIDASPARKYSIPEGGMFEYVSCANYFGEIIEWTGFAIASGSWAGTAFAVYTFCNLAPRAHHHHLWYYTKFDDYSQKNRKAIIPFVW